MAEVIAIELHVPDGSWVTTGVAAQGGRLGTLTSQPVGTREVFVFGWDGDVPFVVLSRGGGEIEHGEIRAVALLAGVDPLADLREGPCELTLWRGSTSFEARLRLEDADVAAALIAKEQRQHR